MKNLAFVSGICLAFAFGTTSFAGDMSSCPKAHPASCGTQLIETPNLLSEAVTCHEEVFGGNYGNSVRRCIVCSDGTVHGCVVEN